MRLKCMLFGHDWYVFRVWDKNKLKDRVLAIMDNIKRGKPDAPIPPGVEYLYEGGKPPLLYHRECKRCGAYQNQLIQYVRDIVRDMRQFERRRERDKLYDLNELDPYIKEHVYNNR